MFQYALGRILAEELGFELIADPIPGFRKTDERVRGLSAKDPTEILTGQTIDLDAVLANRSPRHIVLDGWFQRFEYYRPWRHRIREWLDFDAKIKQRIEPMDIVLSIRRTDYVQLGWALPASFFHDAIERLRPHNNSICIVTDDPYDPFFLKFRRWKPRFLPGSPMEHMVAMFKARKLVMSQSTFSWWPAFLGEQETIICPDPQFGLWAKGGNEDAPNLIERDRFVCLNCEELYVPNTIESIYQKVRLLKRRAVIRVNSNLGTSLNVPSN